MKIKINGDTIDTENIYKITKIEDISPEHDNNIIAIEGEISYTIYLYDTKDTVKISIGVNYQEILNLKITKKPNYFYISNKMIYIGNKKIELTDKIFKDLVDYHDKRYSLLSKHRTDIENIWKENQTTIPQFNI